MTVTCRHCHGHMPVRYVEGSMSAPWFKHGFCSMECHDKADSIRQDAKPWNEFEPTKKEGEDGGSEAGD